MKDIHFVSDFLQVELVISFLISACVYERSWYFVDLPNLLSFLYAKDVLYSC